MIWKFNLKKTKISLQKLKIRYIWKVFMKVLCWQELVKIWKFKKQKFSLKNIWWTITLLHLIMNQKMKLYQDLETNALLLSVINGSCHMVKNNGKTMLKNMLNRITFKLIILRLKLNLKKPLIGWKNGLAQELLDLEQSFLGILSLLLNLSLIPPFTWLTILLLIFYKEVCLMVLKLVLLELNLKSLPLKFGIIFTEKDLILKVALSLKKTFKN